MFLQSEKIRIFTANCDLRISIWLEVRVKEDGVTFFVGNFFLYRPSLVVSNCLQIKPMRRLRSPSFKRLPAAAAAARARARAAGGKSTKLVKAAES